MTVAAMAWVFKQNIPPIPKIVLLTLADQADDETGRVCYGRTNLDHIAAKASVSRRSIYRYIGALVRNNYLVRESGAEKGQPNEYWLQVERAPTHGPWQWFDAENNDEAVNEATADEETGEGAKLAPLQTGGDPVDKPDGGVPPVAQGVCHTWHPQESLDNQSTKESTRPVEKVSGFSKKAQDLDRAKVIREREAAKPAQYFVLEGTRAWDAWVHEMVRRTGLKSWHLTTVRTLNDGKKQRGWYFPSLFPPPNKPAAPPGLAPGELSDEDAQALMGT